MATHRCSVDRLLIAAIEVAAADHIDAAEGVGGGPIEPARHRVDRDAVVIDDVADHLLHIAAVTVGAEDAGHHPKERLCPVDATAQFVDRQRFSRAQHASGVDVGDHCAAPGAVEVDTVDVLQVVKNIQFATHHVGRDDGSTHDTAIGQDRFDRAAEHIRADQVADSTIVDVGQASRWVNRCAE